MSYVKAEAVVENMIEAERAKGSRPDEATSPAQAAAANCNASGASPAAG